MSNTHSATLEAFMSQSLAILRTYHPGDVAMGALAELAWANVVEHDTSSCTYVTAACRIVCEKVLGSGFIMCNGGECALSADRSQVLDLCAEGWPTLLPVAEYEYDITPDAPQGWDKVDTSTEDSDLILDVGEEDDGDYSTRHHSEFPSCD